MDKQCTLIFVMALAVAAGGCEDTPLLVPSDAQFLLSADPSTAEARAADPTGETLFSTIDAMVLSATGQVLPDREVTFTRTDGVLCVDEAACMQGGQTTPLTLETDSGGHARVVLAVNEDDADSITVTARSGAKTATVVVVNPVGVANEDPVVQIGVPGVAPCDTEPGEVCIDSLTVAFVVELIDPSEDPISCYKWQVQPSEDPLGNFPAQLGATLTGVTAGVAPWPQFTQEQEILASLSVTDEAETCDASTAFLVDVSRRIHVCTNTAPTLTMGAPSPSATQSLAIDGVAGTVTFTLTATVGDAETPSGTFLYSWNCDNGQAPIVSATANCSYTTADSDIDVALTVTDEGDGDDACALNSAVGTVSLTVNP